MFDAVNSLPDALYIVIWPFMQFGVFLTIPVLIVVALILRRVRLASTRSWLGSCSPHRRRATCAPLQRHLRGAGRWTL